MHGVRALLGASSQTLGEEWGGEGVVGVVGGTTPDKANPRGRGGGLAGVDGQGYPEGFRTYNQLTVNEYHSGDGIGAHVETHSCFEPKKASYVKP